MNKELKTWSEENEEALIDFYFNYDSDLWEDYYPFDNSIHNTDEAMLKYQENFDEELPEGFIQDVYVTLNERCPKCFMRDDNCNCS
jgi:hypothetical protein